MNHTPPWLPSAITWLAEIRRNGQLSELLQAHAIDCRNAQLPSHRDHCVPGHKLEVAEIARALEQLVGINASTATAMVDSLLGQHPRTQVALELIELYRPRKKPSRSRVATPAEEAEWNPVTGGPAVEAWEEEQRQLALANGGRRPDLKRKERAW